MLGEIIPWLWKLPELEDLLRMFEVSSIISKVIFSMLSFHLPTIVVFSLVLPC